MKLGLRKVFGGMIVLALLVLGFTFNPKQTSALSGSEFNAGRIIDDAVFFNSNSMSVAEIQSFLNSKVDCDFDGSEMTGSITRAQYAAQRGYPTTFTCLPQYKENPTTHENNIGNPNSTPSGAISAAQIIYNASATYGVSSKALIVLLQKEQGLVTDEWPVPNQYRSATGYGCPDTAPCDAQYYGFYNQVSKAAYQFKRYVDNSSNYRYKAGQVNSIYWSPTTSCGASDVFIENGATAALYNYTPYRPNQAALNNLYGTGDSCSAYGNRNFWRYFRDWFGDVYAPNYSWEWAAQNVYSDQTKSNQLNPANLAPGTRYYAKVALINRGNKTWVKGEPRLATVSANNGGGSAYINLNGKLYDPSWISSDRTATFVEDSVAPGQFANFEFWITTPNQAGSFMDYYGVVHDGVRWYYPKNVISLGVKTS